MKPSIVSLARMIQFGAFILDREVSRPVTVGQVIQGIRDGTINSLIEENYGHLLPGGLESIRLAGVDGRAVASALLTVLPPDGHEARQYATVNSGIAFWICLLAEIIARREQDTEAAL